MTSRNPRIPRAALQLLGIEEALLPLQRHEVLDSDVEEQDPDPSPLSSDHEDDGQLMEEESDEEDDDGYFHEI